MSVPNPGTHGQRSSQPIRLDLWNLLLIVVGVTLALVLSRSYREVGLAGVRS